MAEETRRIIHVKGVGKAAQAPDQVVINLNFSMESEKYSSAVKLIEGKITALRISAVDAGFDSNSLKAKNLFVKPIFEYQYSKNKRYKIFSHYLAEYTLEFTFDFTNKKFDDALYILHEDFPNGENSVAFRIKDTAKFQAELLKLAAEDARRKAEILCAASGVKIGKLFKIGCSPEFSDSEIISETDSNDFLALSEIISRADSDNTYSKIFIPKEIEAEIGVDFFWEILD